MELQSIEITVSEQLSEEFLERSVRVQGEYGRERSVFHQIRGV